MPQMSWLQSLTVWPAPRGADMGDGRAHGPEDRLGAREGLRFPPDHDRQGGVRRTDRAARHGRVEERDALLGEVLGHAPHRDRRDRAHVDEKAPARRRRQEAVRTVDHLLDLRRVGQHRDRDVGLPRRVSRARRGRGAMLGEFLDRLGPHVVGAHRVAGLEKVDHHLPAHRSEPDEADRAGCLSHSHQRALASRSFTRMP